MSPMYLPNEQCSAKRVSSSGKLFMGKVRMSNVAPVPSRIRMLVGSQLFSKFQHHASNDFPEYLGHLYSRKANGILEFARTDKAMSNVDHPNEPMFVEPQVLIPRLAHSLKRDTRSRNTGTEME
ncbi:4284_t:CDS:2 [Acaulospora colombiana]|uniref:4284_t:CDS:1 n=1 Tax=Acaulospora colombiana TaxID=27376 RepID=A0ACA9NS86_9GLOM|nr:4284_t:CDS:2 [Acaulospora colombiana]